ncbi:hypothetical protein ASE06_12320 [Sphingopyxis sp. Root214]|nr:hypothetical protein ASD73_09970 [Sphingopyxis sp. Root154]KRC07341.1 hypothetical protein ASE06_12320 [Sphingopyxis sp. Root214]
MLQKRTSRGGAYRERRLQNLEIKSAVDRETGSRHIASFIIDYVSHKTGDFLGLCHALQRTHFCFDFMCGGFARYIR